MPHGPIIGVKMKKSKYDRSKSKLDNFRAHSRGDQKECNGLLTMAFVWV